MFPQTPRNTGAYTRHPTFVTATSGVLRRLPEKLSKKRNACLHAVRQAVAKKIACIHGLRSEGVKNVLPLSNNAPVINAMRMRKGIYLHCYSLDMMSLPTNCSLPSVKDFMQYGRLEQACAFYVNQATPKIFNYFCINVLY